MDDGIQRLVNEIEALLVQEFRLAEAIYQSALDQQTAQLSGTRRSWEMESWQALLAERARLAARQKQVSQELLRLQRPGRRGRRKELERAWSAVLASLEPEIGQRFHRLREGSQILFDRASELSQGTLQLKGEISTPPRRIRVPQSSSL